MKIIAVNGSPNKNGNTYYMLNKMGDYIKASGIDFEVVYLNDALLRLKVPFCLACSTPCNQSCYKDSEFHGILNKVKEADGIIFGSPVYFGSMTAQLKAFFDKSRVQRGEKAFLQKPACVVTVGASKYGGQETTTRAIHDCMMVQGMTVINDGCMEFDCGHFGASAQKPACDDEYGNKRLESMAKRMITAVKK